MISILTIFNCCVAVYFVCYAIYAAAYLCLVALVYRHFWLVGKQEREDLIVHQDEVTYY